MSKAFAELDERELLALAISLEEEDSRIYLHFRERLKKEVPRCLVWVIAKLTHVWDI